ncbi:MAG: GNAT family N-acetyltransferase [Actinomycetes bacterium]|jgi:GNAT superfamily N-acetyltransferase|nr:MAG: GNAT family N-acetyltransferase [Actinomycetota bacterium]
MRRISTPAEARALADLAAAALTLDLPEAPELPVRLATPPPDRRWAAFVLGENDGVVFTSVDDRDPRIGHIDLIAVHPRAQGRGYGKALVRAAEEWLRGEGVRRARWAGNPPCYAWPGIDVRATPAACLAERLGYEHDGMAWNMTADLTRGLPEPPEPPPGVTVASAEPGERAELAAFVREHWNAAWAWEVENAVGAYYAARDGEILGFAAWGARPGWFGPTGTAPSARGLGIGRVLLHRCLAEQRAAGMTSVQIGWVGPLRFYSRAVGARVERVFWQYARDLDA